MRKIEELNEVGNYTVSCVRHNNDYFSFGLYEGKSGHLLWSISGEKVGKTFKLGKLQSRQSSSSFNGNFTTTLELDLLRFFGERFLYNNGVKEVAGKTNSTMANFLEKRGWNAFHYPPYLSSLKKSLSPANNPEPLLFKRLGINDGQVLKPKENVLKTLWRSVFPF